jgi:hypothetical protein
LDQPLKQEGNIKIQSLSPDPPKVRCDVALSEVTDLSLLREAQKELGIKRK